MSNLKVHNNLTTNQNTASFDHREILLKTILDYEMNIKRRNIKYDVYDAIANLINVTPGTVRKYFNKYDETGCKMDSKDLLKICLMIRDKSAIEALSEEYDILTGNDVCQAPGGLVDLTLKTVADIGRLSGDISNSLADNLITKQEHRAIDNIILAAINDLEILKKQLDEK